MVIYKALYFLGYFEIKRKVDHLIEINFSRKGIVHLFSLR